MERTDQLATTIRALRAERGMTREALAFAAGVSVSFVAKMELGTGGTPRLSNLEKLAVALGVSLARLLSEPEVAAS